MNIVFVLGSFYPRGSAVGNCVLNVAIELAQKQNVTVICKRSSFDIEDEYCFKGIRVVLVDTYLSRLRLRLENIKVGGKIVRYQLAVLSLFILKSVEFFMRLTLWKFFDGLIISSYKRAIERTHDQSNIHILVPCVSPIEACIASIKFKNNYPNIHLVPYMFDTLVGNISFYRNSNLLARLYRGTHFKVEENILLNSDRVICMKHFFDDISRNHLNTSNLYVAEHPLLVPDYFSGVGTECSDRINLVFTGALYRKIRNPSTLLSVLEELFKRLPQLEAHFYGGGDCNSIMEEFSRSHSGKFFYHGIVSLREAKLAQSKATALLSIGNSTNFQLPSKIFEYISSFKPIIHFAMNSRDSSIDILRKYPNHLIIDQETDTFITIAEKVIQFLESPKSEIEFADLSSKYIDASPSYTADLILDSMRKPK